MRKGLLSVLMIPLLLLCGCGEREARLEEGFASFRRAVTVAERIAARAELTADYGETATDYALELESDGQMTTIAVVEPELIAGVTASVKWGEATVAFDGVMLGAGPLDEDGLTPVSALPAILNAMASGYVELLWWEGDCIVARLYAGEDSVCTVWLTDDTLTPVSAEIASGGRTVIACRFTQWDMISG